MNLAHRTRLQGNVDDVAHVARNPQRLFSCIPGARLGACRPDGAFDASLYVQTGDVGVSFAGTVTFGSDGAGHAAVRASGCDALRMIRATADVTLRSSRTEDGVTLLEVIADFEFDGPLAPAARAGGGLAASLLMRRFVTCLGELLTHAVGIDT